MTEFTCILVDAKNPQWGNEEHTLINVEAKFEHYEEDWGYLPFMANPNDTEAHGVDLYNRCVNGEFGTIAEYVAPEPTEEPTT